MPQQHKTAQASVPSCWGFKKESPKEVEKPRKSPSLLLLLRSINEGGGMREEKDDNVRGKDAASPLLLDVAVRWEEDV